METKEIRSMRVRRYSLTTVKRFERVVEAFEAAIEVSAFIVEARFDMGAVLSKEGKTVKSLRFLIGDPLMRELAKRVPDAASYAPATVLIEEREDGTHLSYDLMADYLLPYENADASKAARALDEKVERLMEDAA